MSYDDFENEEGQIVEEIEAPSALAIPFDSQEIDKQIATAKAYPRTITKFKSELLALATLDEETAAECIYALPRGGKTIEGPSARFAELVNYCWGNTRAAAHVVAEEDEFVVAQGAFYDLERNLAIAFRVKRRITGKGGRRYDSDMIGVTGNAASSIAYRNSVLRGVPKPLWKPIYQKARLAAIGEVTTLANTRAKSMEAFGKMGVTPEMIFGVLNIAGLDDVTLDHCIALRGMFTTLKNGESSVEQMFVNPLREKGTHPKTESVAQGTASSLNDIKARHGVADPKQQPSSPETGTATAASPTVASETKQQTPASSTSPKEGLFEAPNPFANEPRGRRR